MLVSSDATFRDLPASMETESSNGKEGVVMSTYLIDIVIILCSLRVFATRTPFCQPTYIIVVSNHLLSDRRRELKAPRLQTLSPAPAMRRVGGSWGRWSCSAPCAWSGSLRTRSPSTPRMYRISSSPSSSSCSPVLCAWWTVLTVHPSSLLRQDLSSLHDQLCVPLQRVPSQRQHVLSQKTSK